jgi:hypothetical protein
MPAGLRRPGCRAAHSQYGSASPTTKLRLLQRASSIRRVIHMPQRLPGIIVGAVHWHDRCRAKVRMIRLLSSRSSILGTSGVGR